MRSRLLAAVAACALAGRSPAQTSIIPQDFARHIMTGDCQLCVLRDSISTDGSSFGNIPHGIQRSWRPQTVVARVGRAYNGPPSWAVEIGLTTDDYLRTIRGPGSVYGGGQVAISPNNGEDHVFLSNLLPDEWSVYYWRIAGDFAAGDPFSGAPTIARSLWWRAPGQGVFSFTPTRNLASVGPTMPVDMASGATGLAWTDADCGSGSGRPGTSICKVGDQTGKRVYHMGTMVYRHAGGQRVPGFGLMQIGEGGWRTVDHLDPARCTDAALTDFMAATLRPNTFLLYIGTNRHHWEAVELEVGITTAYKANVEAMIARYTSAAIAAGATPPIRWLLVNPHYTGGGHIIHSSMGTALRELAEADPAHRAFIDIYAMEPNSTPWLADTAHPTAEGARHFAGRMWERIAAAACYANCDESTEPPVLNVADFTCFLQKFSAGEAYANCDGSTAAPVLNIADFTCYLQRFAAGCE